MLFADPALGDCAISIFFDVPPVAILPDLEDVEFPPDLWVPRILHPDPDEQVVAPLPVADDVLHQILELFPAGDFHWFSIDPH